MSSIAKQVVSTVEQQIRKRIQHKKNSNNDSIKTKKKNKKKQK